MCSVIILSRPDHDWPILIASNRDEMHERPWDPPGRHWPDRPDVVAGRDKLAGGSWLGMNDFGVVAGILNRRNTLGPQEGKRSRGELVLDDNTHAYWLRNTGQEIEAQPLLPGLSMITAMDLNDMESARTRHYLPRWQAAEAPDPGAGKWESWVEVLQSREYGPGGDVFDAMHIVSNTGFGTISSSLMALPSVNHSDLLPRWRFLGGRPETISWIDVDLS